MSSFLLSKSEQGIVVFHFWKSLGYIPRMFLSFLFIIAGFVCQYYMLYFLPGVLLVLIGNLLLLVKGYDNRIKLDGYSAETDWIKTDIEHLNEIADLNRKLKKWDVSSLDVTNPKGWLIFVVILLVLFFAYVYFIFESIYANIYLIVASNIVVLLIPHWVTGVKRITTTPALVEKIEIYQKVSEKCKDKLNPHTVSYLMMVNNQKKFPTDVKMKINFKNQQEDFLGLYAQISMNDVNGSNYPYFYVVLVAKAQSKLLQSFYNAIELPGLVLKELKEENDVEILVIRQRTTKDSGYYTNDNAVEIIFNAGLDTVNQILSKA